MRVAPEPHRYARFNGIQSNTRSSLMIRGKAHFARTEIMVGQPFDPPAGGGQAQGRSHPTAGIGCTKTVLEQSRAGNLQLSTSVEEPAGKCQAEEYLR